MKDLKFSKQTAAVSLIFFAVYAIYGLFRVPFVQYLVSMAVGGIAYGIVESYEIALIAVLAMNFLYPLFSGARTYLPAAPAAAAKEGFMSTNPAEISKRLDTMRRRLGPAGVGSPMSEGFEDADTSDMTLNKEESENSESVTATSVPAPVEKAADKKEDFESGGLFKLGKIPEDAKGGFHIDAGTTVMNALNSLKPDQINAMTKDTKQLIETQKSLMNLLQTFTPMVSEGQQMMDTFNSMFSPAMGSMKTAQGMLGGGN